ncbi:hypothetical protein NA57DRAFT_74042 [Rhizodiscina lignyota]|uniref:Uncharacterized protein n=1 Tax=Rhizodiscina lignyota TaxID=1504668 RepID=A0A9P4IJI5_9PEZI|nr:hypothetical protein NA57DRAFT_74042 [Rhizodiscina lignyota]
MDTSSHEYVFPANGGGTPQSCDDSTAALCPSSLHTEHHHHRPGVHESYDDGLQAQQSIKGPSDVVALSEETLALNEDVLKMPDLTDPTVQEMARARIEKAA